jgi:hypothetical protein
VLEARFVPAETTPAYFDCLHAYIRRYGCPVALYSDRHSIFTKHDPEDAEPTPFQRALSALEIAGIQARFPQAKGRVERLFQTLQDRLTKALRLADIADMESANAVLPAYLEAHNERSAVAPIDTHDAHRPCVLSAQELARLCVPHDCPTTGHFYFALTKTLQDLSADRFCLYYLSLAVITMSKIYF